MGAGVFAQVDGAHDRPGRPIDHAQAVVRRALRAVVADHGEQAIATDHHLVGAGAYRQADHFLATASVQGRHAGWTCARRRWLAVLMLIIEINQLVQ
ncbi:hypothetical protein WR25_14123 [Diploscapter pachys]|uniref:Uncharacterized protein n=1 Tax=Diploscapter pachys TaxID=2018661 RepID=A0A2A2K6D9_9BILA|nr:hypothetical protein WR25_14123 [Diploscapter pachys]